MIDYDKWCRRCKHYKFDLSMGILCGLSQQNPQFDSDCESFLLDSKLEEKIEYERKRDTHTSSRKRTLGVYMPSEVSDIEVKGKYGHQANLHYDVDKALKNGDSHQTILSKYEGDAQEQVAIYLSHKIEFINASLYKNLHRLIYSILGILLFINLGAFLTLASWIFIIIFAGIILLIFMIRKRNAWGYNGVILYSIWSTVGSFLDLNANDGNTVEDMVLISVAQIFVFSLGFSALYLRVKLFPHMGFLGPRRDEEGVFTIMKVINKSEDNYSNNFDK